MSDDIAQKAGIGYAFANLLLASTDEERKAAAKEFADAQTRFQKEAAKLGCRVTFGKKP